MPIVDIVIRIASAVFMLFAFNEIRKEVSE